MFSFEKHLFLILKHTIISTDVFLEDYFMFHSTRGEKLVSSPMAILNGLADDGGLYVID